MARLLLAALLVVIYIVWSGNTDPGDIAILAVAALVSAMLFSKPRGLPRITPKRIAWSVAYVFYIFIEIIKANFDVARRVVQPVIPINPGIVTVRTKLGTPLGRTVLANSITLTPGTLSVEIKGDLLYVHWIDVSSSDLEEATGEIVAGFEKYLEVIFG